MDHHPVIVGAPRGLQRTGQPRLLQRNDDDFIPAALEDLRTGRRAGPPARPARERHRRCRHAQAVPAGAAAVPPRALEAGATCRASRGWRRPRCRPPAWWCAGSAATAGRKAGCARAAASAAGWRSTPRPSATPATIRAGQPAASRRRLRPRSPRQLASFAAQVPARAGRARDSTVPRAAGCLHRCRQDALLRHRADDEQRCFGSARRDAGGFRGREAPRFAIIWWRRWRGGHVAAGRRRR